MNIEGGAGEVRMTVQVKRAATGEVETYELTGHLINDRRPRVHHDTSGVLLGEGAQLSSEKEQRK